MSANKSENWPLSKLRTLTHSHYRLCKLKTMHFCIFLDMSVHSYINALVQNFIHDSYFILVLKNYSTVHLGTSGCFPVSHRRGTLHAFSYATYVMIRLIISANEDLIPTESN